MQRLPHGPRFDVPQCQLLADRVPAAAELLGLDRQAGQPAGRLMTRRLGHEVEARVSGQGPPVIGVVAPPPGNAIGQDLQLAASHGRQQVAHPVVVTDLRMLVVGCRIAGLGGQKTGPAAQFGILGDQHPAAAGRDDLVAVQRKAAHPAETARRPAAVDGPQGLGRILDQRHLVLLAEGFDPRVIGALTVQVHHQHRFGQPPPPGTDRQLFGQQLRVQVPGRPLAVQEHGRGTRISNRVGGGGKGQRRRQHLIPRPHTQQDQGQMQGGRAGGKGHRLATPQRRGELLFQSVHLRPQRSNPIRIERLQQQRPLGPRHVRR